MLASVLNKPSPQGFDRVKVDSPSATAHEIHLISDLPQGDEVQSNFDGFFDGAIMGWIWNPATPKKSVTVQLFLGEEPILAQQANLYRQDLEAAGMNEGRCAFRIPVPANILEQARQLNKLLTVCVEHQLDNVVCAVDMNERLGVDQRLRALLTDTLLKSREGVAEAKLTFLNGKKADDPAPRQPTYIALLEWPSSVISAPRDSPMRLSPYCEYVRRCNGLESQFSPEVSRGDYDHFIRWYLDEYGTSYRPMRVPLSADAIRYLNETLAFGGHRFTVTRAMLWFLVEEQQDKFPALLDREENYRDILYWWVAEKTKSLNVDDCLVTRQQIEFMRSIPNEWIKEPFPINNFSYVAFHNRAELKDVGSIFDIGTRITVYFFLIVEALNAPGILRFIPTTVLECFLGQGSMLFDQFVRELLSYIEPPHLDASTYRKIIGRQGFDMAALRFKSIDARGHRIETVRLPPPPTNTPHQVQVIGPFSKTSGLARACQTTRDALRKTELDCVFTDFTVNNPQPDAPFDGAIGDCGRARINIIHLNPDMLPEAIAYLPDVFTQARNIGFFFWELNEPAECHRLALELVDEIWVASEYNRCCFAAHTDKPVINMGMAIAYLARPDRAAGRSFLNQRFGIDGEKFVFFSSYDSLSYLQRKNPIGAVRAFQDAFPGDDTVRLILKTHNASSLAGTPGAKNYDSLIRFCDEDPRIKLLDEILTYEALMDIAGSSDCYVSLHRSEGFGFGMLEAMTLGVPVICTGYSGNMDFCSEQTAWLVDYDEVALRFEDYAHVTAGHRWAEPRQASAVTAMRAVRMDNVERNKRSRAAEELASERYSLAALANRYADRLKAILEL